MTEDKHSEEEKDAVLSEQTAAENSQNDKEAAADVTGSPDDGLSDEQALTDETPVQTEAAPDVTESPDDGTSDEQTITKEAPGQTDEKPKKRGLKIFRRVICIISVIAFLCSGTVIVKRGVEYYRMKQTESDIDALTIPDTGGIRIDSRDPAYLAALIKKYPYLAAIQFPVGFNYRYAQLYAANPDFVGYLSIDSTSIHTAVVQHSNDDYYYDHDYYGKETRYGAIFATAQNNMLLLDQNTVIIGHHMKDGSRFHDLILFKTIEGYKKSPVIEFNTSFADYQWKVYGAFILNGSPTGDNDYKLNCLFNNVSPENFAAYINEIQKRTLYTTGVDLLPTDKILTLMTCTYEFKNARLIVIARMVREGEATSVDLSKVTDKSEPIKYPQAYYDKRGKTNPYSNDIKWYPNPIV